MNLNYILVYVNDFQKSKSFYVDALGMTDIGSRAPDIFATLRSRDGGAIIGLQDKKSTPLAPAQEQHSGSVELSFSVEDVDATYKRWKEKGVEMLTEPADMPFGRYFLAMKAVEALPAVTMMMAPGWLCATLATVGPSASSLPMSMAASMTGLTPWRAKAP